MTKTYVAIFAVAVLARAGWGLFALTRADDPRALEFPDERQFWLMAGSLQAGDGLVDEFGFRATRMPLYPAALSLAAGLTNGVIVAKVVQWLVGAAAAVLSAALATAVLNRRVGLVAGLYVALDPFLVFLSSLLLTETVFLVVMLVLYRIIWRVAAPEPGGGSLRRWLSAGLVTGLAVYVRESSVGLAAVLLCFVVVCRGFDRRVIAGAALTVVVVVVMLVPWAARNDRLTGDWCWLTHRGGISLYDGVGPGADGSSDLGDVSQMPAVRELSEVEWNRYFLRESIRSIRNDPGRILRLAGAKLGRMWNPFPNVETYQSRFVRTVSVVWTVPAFALGLAGAVLLSRMGKGGGVRIVVFLLLPAVYLSALHGLFVGSVRYRLAAMPMIEILAAFALVAILDRARTWTAPEGHTLDS